MSKLRQILPGFGVLLFVVGLLIAVNGGGYTVGAIGVGVLAMAFLMNLFHMWDMISRAEWNWIKHWANRERE